MLPSETGELLLYRFVESAAKSQWRPTTISALGSVCRNLEWPVVVDILKRLQSQELIALRKSTSQGFRSYPTVDSTTKRSSTWRPSRSRSHRTVAPILSALKKKRPNGEVFIDRFTGR